MLPGSGGARGLVGSTTGACITGGNALEVAGGVRPVTAGGTAGGNVAVDAVPAAGAVVAGTVVTEAGASGVGGRAGGTVNVADADSDRGAVVTGTAGTAGIAGTTGVVVIVAGETAVVDVAPATGVVVIAAVVVVAGWGGGVGAGGSVLVTGSPVVLSEGVPGSSANWPRAEITVGESDAANVGTAARSNVRPISSPVARENTYVFEFILAHF